MAYQQVKEIVQHVQSLRQRIMSLAKSRQEAADDRMLAQFLERAQSHDQYMKQCLDGEVQQAPAAVLETWIQFPDTQPLEREIDALADDRENSSGEIVQQVLSLDGRIMHLYETAAEQARSEGVKNFFEHLLLMERQKARAKGWSYTQSRDMGEV